MSGPPCIGPWLTLHNSVIARFKGDEPELVMYAEDFPTFLYDESAGWNPRNLRNGLFRGHVLVRVGGYPSQV